MKTYRFSSFFCEQLDKSAYLDEIYPVPVFRIKKDSYFSFSTKLFCRFSIFAHFFNIFYQFFLIICFQTIFFHFLFFIHFFLRVFTDSGSPSTRLWPRVVSGSVDHVSCCLVRIHAERNGGWCREPTHRQAQTLVLLPYTTQTRRNWRIKKE